MRGISAAAISPQTLVLQERAYRPGTDVASLSRYDDAVWDLTPAVFEDHSARVSINFAVFNDRWEPTVRAYLWMLINGSPRGIPGAVPEARLSMRSVSLIKSSLAALLARFDLMGITDLAQLDPLRLDELVVDLGRELSFDRARKMLTEIRRLWAHRDLLDAPMRMPDEMPWNGDRAFDLIAPPRSTAGSRTPRISDATLVPLIAWAGRFVEDFSDDIVAAFRLYRELIVREYRHRPVNSEPTQILSHAEGRANIVRALELLRDAGVGLPGRVAAAGSRSVNWSHIGRIARVSDTRVRTARSLIEGFGLPIDDDAYLPIRCTGSLDGRPWRDKPIAWADAPRFATWLQTACFLVIGYLSGMRAGEVLSLERGCLDFDAQSNIWTIKGRRWKGVRDSTGSKEPEGRIRENPWVVHPTAARAVQILEQINDHQLLFPIHVRPQALRGITPQSNLRDGEARTTSQMGTDILDFTRWVNEYATANGRADLIPDDPHGRVNARRLRRTLAWHIVRRPRGLVAAAVQYGHIATLITQGYGGNYASGFPDELAFERWLERYEHLSEIDSYRIDGGRISGPAASGLADRAAATTARFAGRPVPTHRQARTLLRNPNLQVYPGEGMHCVYNAETALCARDSDEPVLGNCRSACRNIARTDDDIAQLKQISAQLQADGLAPPIRHQRAQALIAHHDATIAEHERTPAR